MSVLAHRNPEQRGVFPKVTPARSRGIEVDHAVDRVGLGQVLVEDQAPGTYADSGRRLRADQREVVERVAHACHPVGYRVITDLSVCGITQAQVVKTQHAKSPARTRCGRTLSIPSFPSEPQISIPPLIWLSTGR